MVWSHGKKDLVLVIAACCKIAYPEEIVEFATILACKCDSGQVLTGTSGLLISPHYGNSYCGNMNCTWRIAVPNGYLVQLQINQVNMNPGDYLAIFEPETNPFKQMLMK